MLPTRPRRCVRRTLLALAAIVLLLNAYIGTWIGLSWAYSRHIIGDRSVSAISPVFAPLVGYCKSDLPGARGLSRLWWKAIPGFGETDSNDPARIALRQNHILFYNWIESSPLAPPMPR